MGPLSVQGFPHDDGLAAYDAASNIAFQFYVDCALALVLYGMLTVPNRNRHVLQCFFLAVQEVVFVF